ncbi:MAG: NAD-dependent epimerase/dehydratase family protein [Candidatus Altiarchaeota archaeon]
MKIFVTGASGFVGSNLVRRLVDDGHKVVCLMRENSQHPLLEGLEFERVTGDLLIKDSFEKVLDDCDVAFHCAAVISFSTYALGKSYPVNVEGTRNVLDACVNSGVKRLVFTSACATIGISKTPDVILDESSAWMPPESWAYAYTKHLSEQMVLSYADKGLETIALNPSAVYGRGDHNMNTGMAVKQIQKNRMLASPPGGTSYVSIKDLVDAHVLAMKRGKPGNRYILVKENLRYIDLFNRIAEAVGSNKIKFTLPVSLHYPIYYSMTAAESIMHFLGLGELPVSAHIMDELFMFKYYSNEKAGSDLGWKPKDSIETAVLDAMEYYKRQEMF